METQLARLASLMFILTITIATAPQSTAQTVGTPGALEWKPSTARIDPPEGQDYRFSLCEGRVLQPGEVSRPCTRQNAGERIYGGNQASFVFASEPGSALPVGVTLDPYGILHVAEGVQVDPASLRVCVRQLNVTAACRNVGLKRDPLPEPPQQAQQPAAAPAEAPPATAAAQGGGGGGGGGALLGIAVAAGAGAVGIGLYCKENPEGCGGGESCDQAEGNRLNQQLRTCVNNRFQGCNRDALYADYDRWCRSCGFSRFDVGLSGCR